MTEFKIGERVFHPSYGWGTVSDISENQNRNPVVVVFDVNARGLIMFFKKNGKITDDEVFQSLSHSEYKRKEDKPLFKVKDRVFCVIFGWGTIKLVNHHNSAIDYHVEFDGLPDARAKIYNENGAITANANRTLFKSERVIKKSKNVKALGVTN